MKVVYIGERTHYQQIFSRALRLRWPDVRVEAARLATEGLMELGREPADLVCLCPGFEDMSLAETIVAVRRFTKVPLMVLSEDAKASDAVVSLDAGADDYVRIPCDLTELVAHAWALMRRSGWSWSVDAPSPSPTASCSLYINPATFEVFLGQQNIQLTFIETQVLHTLVKNRTTIVPTPSLINQVWGQQAMDSNSRVKKCIQRLRRKLGDDASSPTWIANIHGVGYRFIGPASNNPQAESEYSIPG